MKRILQCRRGEGYIDVVVGVLVSMMMIVLALNVFTFLTLKQDMDHYAKEMIKTATVTGRTTGTEINNRKNELTAETGISPTIAWSASYFNASQQVVQLSDTITVTLTMNTTVRGMGVISVPVTLTAKHSGISQKYWK